jgi:hypothetical protein
MNFVRYLPYFTFCKHIKTNLFQNPLIKFFTFSLCYFDETHRIFLIQFIFRRFHQTFDKRNIEQLFRSNYSKSRFKQSQFIVLLLLPDSRQYKAFDATAFDQFSIFWIMRPIDPLSLDWASTEPQLAREERTSHSYPDQSDVPRQVEVSQADSVNPACLALLLWSNSRSGLQLIFGLVSKEIPRGTASSADCYEVRFFQMKIHLIGRRLKRT